MPESNATNWSEENTIEEILAEGGVAAMAASHKEDETEMTVVSFINEDRAFTYRHYTNSAKTLRTTALSYQIMEAEDDIRLELQQASFNGKSGREPSDDKRLLAGLTDDDPCGGCEPCRGPGHIPDGEELQDVCGLTDDVLNCIISTAGCGACKSTCTPPNAWCAACILTFCTWAIVQCCDDWEQQCGGCSCGTL